MGEKKERKKEKANLEPLNCWAMVCKNLLGTMVRLFVFRYKHLGVRDVTCKLIHHG